MDLLQFQLSIHLLFIMPLLLIILLLFIMPLLLIILLLFIMVPLFMRPLLSNKLQLFPIRLSLHNMSHLLAFMELLTILLIMDFLVIQQCKMFISRNLLDNLKFQ